MYLCPSFIIVQIEEELAKEKDNTARLENTVSDLTSQCTISLQQTEEFRKEVKEKVSAMNCLIVKWQTDWFHGKFSGHVRCPLVNTRQQQRPYLLSKDVVRACLHVYDRDSSVSVDVDNLRRLRHGWCLLWCQYPCKKN